MPDEKSTIEINELIAKATESDLKTIEPVVSQLMEVINNPDSSVRELKEIIEIDPPLSARVLKIANSAYYASPQKIDEIQKAIIWLGFDTLKEIALNQKVCELFADAKTIYDFSRSELWKHSVAVALFGKTLFRREFGERGADVYSVGLLHEIGLIIEDQFIHDKFIDLLREKQNKQLNLPELERRKLGFDHAQLGAEIAHRWALPEDLIEAIRVHHDTNIIDKNHRKIVHALYIADFVCQKHGIGYCDSPNRDETDFFRILKELNIKQRALDFILEEVMANLEAMEQEGFFTK